MSSKTQALDLYSKVEDLLGVKEAALKLYAHYLLYLQQIEFDSLLDVGCGSGDFLHAISGVFARSRLSGIDLSPLMIKKANELGVDAKCIDICDVDESFDVITAVFDMLNYLDDNALEDFLACLHDRLNDDGYLMCDINTLYGFEEVAVGSFIVDADDRFLTIDSDFEDDVYSSEFTLFEKTKKVYTKSQESILQYYHTIDKIESYSGLVLVSQDEVQLYGNKSDKVFLVFKKQ
jgi:predicted TPR repeat methyltransferase